MDDEARFRDTCRRLLNGRGYEVTPAENGQVALEILAKKALDVILLDLKMPVMGGEKVLEITAKSTQIYPLLLSRAMAQLIQRWSV